MFKLTAMHTKKVGRDITIDIVKGLATMIMTFAHCTAVVLNSHQQQIFMVRLAASFAAPLFIVVSGMMVGRSVDARTSIPWFHILQRSAILIFISSVILEVFIYGILPFASMDVLCLIGISLPLTAFLHRWSISWRCFLTCAVFAITPALQWYIPYREDFDVWGFVDIENADDLKEYIFQEVPQRMLIDGSFPIFPWLGFTLAGSIFATWRWGGPSERGKFSKHIQSPNLWVGKLLALLGAYIWHQNPGPMYIHNGFCELFYPTSIGYSITAFGVVAVIFSLVDLSLLQEGYFILSAVYNELVMLGRCSLFVYLLQYTILFRILQPYNVGPDTSIIWQLVIFAFIFIVCITAAKHIDKIKRERETMPFLLGFLLGS